MAEQAGGHGSDVDGRGFPFHRFEGTHREVGRAFGDACGELIETHLDRALRRLRAKGVSVDAAEAALQYRPVVVDHAPFLDEEIHGVAEGAGISLAQAYFLQLRAELATPRADECTTFAALPIATATGGPIAAQNADLPAFYQRLGVVVHLQPEGSPDVLMLTPAGQVSYVGINQHGLGVVANFLVCDGWRIGFPRYLLSRVALEQRSARAAADVVATIPRASSRNLLLVDSDTAIDFENTPTRHALLEPADGLLAHANHYLAPELRAEERASPEEIENSTVRLERVRELLERRRGDLDVAACQEILRDRERTPHALSRERGDDPSDDVITFASMIAEPAAGRVWVAPGPPSTCDYTAHEMGAVARRSA